MQITIRNAFSDTHDVGYEGRGLEGIRFLGYGKRIGYAPIECLYPLSYKPSAPNGFQLRRPNLLFRVL